jgi:D-glycerate 3-kinase
MLAPAPTLFLAERGMIAALLRNIIDETRSRAPARPALIGVSGAQGSGKSHQCRQFVAEHPRIAHFSLDDVYFTRAERERLAKQFHPFFLTRGPPGTHAVGLALSIFARLRNASRDALTPLPRFDKASDDRTPESDWPIFVGRPDAILFDGWCLGAAPDALGEAPINGVEREDADRIWRTRIREDLADRYAKFFASFDAIMYLKPPSWEIVKRWRAEQEAQTLGRALTSEDHARLDRFMQHYERMTKSMMAGGHCADWVVELDEGRGATRMSRMHR